MIPNLKLSCYLAAIPKGFRLITCTLRTGSPHNSPQNKQVQSTKRNAAMGRYDDLRRMREAKFAATAPVTKPVIKLPEGVTKGAAKPPTIDIVTKPKTGHPLLGDQPMSAAQRMRRYRAKLTAPQATALSNVGQFVGTAADRAKS